MEKEKKEQGQNLLEELEEKQVEKPMSDDDFDSLIAETMGKFGIPEENDDGDFEQEQKEPAVNLNDHGAKLIAQTIDFMAQQAAAAYSGASPGTFKMDDETKEQYTAAWAAYLETMNYTPSPITVLLAVVFTHAGMVGYQAHEYKAAAEKAKQAERAMFVRSTSTDPAELRKASEELKETQKGPKRRRFQIDDDGFFTFEAEGGPSAYIKASERTEKPDAKVKAWIDELRGKGLAWPDVNNHICKRLGYSKNNAQGQGKK